MPKGKPRAGFKKAKIYVQVCANPGCGIRVKVKTRKKLRDSEGVVIPWKCVRCRERKKYFNQTFRTRFEKRHQVSIRDMERAVGLGRAALRKLEVLTEEFPLYQALNAVTALLVDLRESRVQLQMGRWGVHSGEDRCPRRLKTGQFGASFATKKRHEQHTDAHLEPAAAGDLQLVRKGRG